MYMKKILLAIIVICPLFLGEIEAKEMIVENKSVNVKKNNPGWITENKDIFYIDENGDFLIGINSIGNVLYFFENDGTLCKQNKWKCINNNWYYVKNNGELKIGWFLNDEGWHYFDKNGVLVKGWQNINGYTYLFNEKGIITTGWKNDGKWRFFDSQGHMYTGWQVIDKKRYYFDNNGYISIGINLIDNKFFYFNELGHLTTTAKWKYINSNWYYIKNNGELKIGWFLNDEGWHYFNESGEMLVGWHEIGGNTYLFNERGIITTGWRNNGGWRYFNEQGHMYTGWQNVGNNQYYFNQNGYITTDLADIEDKTYFFNDEGHMLTGDIVVNGEIFLFDSDGHLVKNEWINKDGKSIYYDENGKILKNTTRVIDGIKYEFDKNGYIDSWLIGNDGYIYYYNNGVKLTGWQKLGGQKYYFNKQGHRIGNGSVKKVIDVSEHNGVIDWDKVQKSADIDHVILRIGFGDVREDYQLSYNIEELRKRNIPFSLYLYSYAENKLESESEAQFVINVLKKYSIEKNTKIYYDIEKPSYLDGRDVKIKPSQYKVIIPTFINMLKTMGYTDIGVYTYTSYLYSSSSGFGGDSGLIKYVEWLAQYADHVYQDGKTINETYFNGWQYTSSEQISGINTNVDLSVFF